MYGSFVAKIMESGGQLLEVKVGITEEKGHLK